MDDKIKGLQTQINELQQKNVTQDQAFEKEMASIYEKIEKTDKKEAHDMESVKIRLDSLFKTTQSQIQRISNAESNIQSIKNF